jgi:catechol 2,3-dioxygenase-like lactoylglutathione lyase family enzyme
MAAKLEAVQPVLMVSNMTVSVRFFQGLGFSRSFGDDQYSGVSRDGLELHLQWHEAADFASGDRPTYRFVVSDVDALYEEFAGAIKVEGPWGKPGDTPWGTREFHVRDPDGNALQFYR